jgi:hypothetical protein
LGESGGRYWTRTSDLHNVNVMRYQLRQPPKKYSIVDTVINEIRP